MAINTREAQQLRTVNFKIQNLDKNPKILTAIKKILNDQQVSAMISAESGSITFTETADEVLSIQQAILLGLARQGFHILLKQEEQP